MNPHYARVAERAGHRCEYCHAPEAIFNFPFEVEHIVPTGHGGTDTVSNWALSCRACNLYKSDHLLGFDARLEAASRSFIRASNYGMNISPWRRARECCKESRRLAGPGFPDCR